MHVKTSLMFFYSWKLLPGNIFISFAEIVAKILSEKFLHSEKFSLYDKKRNCIIEVADKFIDTFTGASSVLSSRLWRNIRLFLNI